MRIKSEKDFFAYGKDLKLEHLSYRQSFPGAVHAGRKYIHLLADIDVLIFASFDREIEVRVKRASGQERHQHISITVQPK